MNARKALKCSPCAIRIRNCHILCVLPLIHCTTMLRCKWHTLQFVTEHMSAQSHTSSCHVICYILLLKSYETEEVRTDFKYFALQNTKTQKFIFHPCNRPLASLQRIISSVMRCNWWLHNVILHHCTHHKTLVQFQNKFKKHVNVLSKTNFQEACSNDLFYWFPARQAFGKVPWLSCLLSIFFGLARSVQRLWWNLANFLYLLALFPSAADFPLWGALFTCSLKKHRRFNIQTGSVLRFYRRNFKLSNIFWDPICALVIILHQLCPIRFCQPWTQIDYCTVYSHVFGYHNFGKVQFCPFAYKLNTYVVRKTLLDIRE